MKTTDATQPNSVLNHPAKPRLPNEAPFCPLPAPFTGNQAVAAMRYITARAELEMAMRVCQFAAFGLSYAVVRITRPLPTTGDELPSPGIVLLHLMFSLLLFHTSGRFGSDKTPSPSGPRH